MTKVQTIMQRVLLFVSFFLFILITNIFSQTSIFTTQIPINSGNDSDYELGVKFISSQTAEITAIRFYKMPGETGSHTGKIWNSSGSLITTVNFTSETSSGWQTAQLTTPLIISPNTIYIVSVNSNSVYPIEQNQLSVPITNSFLSTVADGNNGVFNETVGLFPNQSYNNSNYFIDILANSLNSIFTTQTPLGEFNDGPYELGVKFTSSQTSKVKYISYYKMPGESGSHTGNLWDINGNLLASAQFVNETSSGWQYALLNTNVYIYSGTDYVVSVNSNFTYAASQQQALASPVANGVLSTIADNNNGVYSGAPNTQGQFPTFSFNNVNYFRDVLVEPLTPPSIPLLISPADFSTGNSIETILTWEASPGATSYTLQVASDINFLNLVFNVTDITSTNYSLPTLLNNQTYYWRVSAEKEVVTSGFSTPFRFTTIGFTSVALSWPIGGVSIYTNPPSFAWFLPMGGTGWKYDLIISNNIGFNSPIIISNLDNNTAAVSGLLPGTLYYWKVRLKTSAGVVVGYSNTETFITFGQALVPVPSAPVGNTIINTLAPTLYWYLNDASFGLTYEVEIRAGNSSALTGNATHTNIANQNITVSGLLPGQQYAWKVRSKSGSNYSAWSNPALFQTVAIAGPVVPIPSWPIGYATVYTTSPSLNWYLGSSVTGLTYQAEYVQGLSTSFSGVANITNISGLSTSLNGLTPGADYKWRVRSTDGISFSAWSSIASFKVSTTITNTPITPVPSWPIGNAIVYSSSTQLNWYLGTISNGLTYEVELTTGTLTGTPTITGINNLFVTITGLTSGSNYKWRVRSTNGTNTSSWSAIATFQTVGTQPVATIPILSWPIGGATVYTNNPTLSWFLNSPGTGLTYQLQYATNISMTGATTITGIANTNYVLTGLTSGTMYYWRVRSFDGTVYSAYSSIGNFATAAGNFSVIPVAASPAEGTTITSSSSSLSWFLPTNGDVKGYQLQFSKKIEMENPVTIIANESNYEISGLESNTEYYWRVRSFNSGNEFSEFSGIEKFKTSTITSIENKDQLPTEFSLQQNFPNPFNPSTTISFNIAKEGFFSLDVFNVLGEKVASLAHNHFHVGNYSIRFDAGSLSSGIYFYKLSGTNILLVKKMLLVK